jgi:hypothetical protein
VEFDWNEVHAESLTRTVELRQQRWRIKQRELELMASKNLLLPRLDVVARHRWLGLGDDLINSDGRAYNAANEDLLADTDAFSTLVDGNFQESQIGLQFNMPLGFRRELATVRNQQLLVAREREVLKEEELELSHALAEAVRILDTSYKLMQTNFNRVVAAEKQVEAVQSLFDTGLVTLDLLLDAQRRLADALSAGYRAQADYNRNIAQVHFRKGSLLEYNDVYLAEGPWPGKAYFDAHRHARARDAAYFLDYGFTRPDVISRGPVDHEGGEFIPHDGMIEGGVFGAEEIPTPAGGQPTPAEPMPADPMEAAPEEMPGPATMKPARNRMQYSKSSRRYEGRQASYDEEVSTPPAKKRNSAFDWKIDRSSAASEDDSADRAIAAPASEDEGMTVLRVTASSDSISTGEGSSTRAEESAAAGSSQNTRTRAASGWKKAER